ncbi:hypothetical protein [Micavibrio aeruginosavorus]|uniref:hypothetical protein n=1 Tax=Micavibrio aeruginosavorus TaxID=349221 RepID=UPI003F4AF666
MNLGSNQPTTLTPLNVVRNNATPILVTPPKDHDPPLFRQSRLFPAPFFTFGIFSQNLFLNLSRVHLNNFTNTVTAQSFRLAHCPALLGRRTAYDSGGYAEFGCGSKSTLGDDGTGEQDNDKCIRKSKILFHG